MYTIEHQYFRTISQLLLLYSDSRRNHTFVNMPEPAYEYTAVQPPQDTYPKDASRNNATGTDTDVLECMKVREICEGWGLYRDTAEWENYASMFHPDAYITTSWTQGRLKDLIASSKEGFEKQAPNGPFPYILHRICGQTVDVQVRSLLSLSFSFSCISSPHDSIRN
jgi:hypothetical protein